MVNLTRHAGSLKARTGWRSRQCYRDAGRAMSPMPLNADNFRTASDLRKALFRLNGCQLANRRNQIFWSYRFRKLARAKWQDIICLYGAIASKAGVSLTTRNVLASRWKECLWQRVSRWQSSYLLSQIKCHRSLQWSPVCNSKRWAALAFDRRRHCEIRQPRRSCCS